MNQPNILLVEDSEDDVFFFKRVFSRASVAAKIDVATDGAKAIEYLSAHGDTAPDVIFLDLKMPNQNGFEFLEWLRKNPTLGNTKIFILTSSSQAQERDQAAKLGANAYFVKPLTSDKLREALELLAEKSRHQ